MLQYLKPLIRPKFSVLGKFHPYRPYPYRPYSVQCPSLFLKCKITFFLIFVLAQGSALPASAQSSLFSWTSWCISVLGKQGDTIKATVGIRLVKLLSNITLVGAVCRMFGANIYARIRGVHALGYVICLWRYAIPSFFFLLFFFP